MDAVRRHIYRIFQATEASVIPNEPRTVLAFVKNCFDQLYRKEKGIICAFHFFPVGPVLIDIKYNGNVALFCYNYSDTQARRFDRFCVALTELGLL